LLQISAEQQVWAVQWAAADKWAADKWAANNRKTGVVREDFE
jgi:hypothetical protein